MANETVCSCRLFRSAVRRLMSGLVTPCARTAHLLRQYGRRGAAVLVRALIVGELVGQEMNRAADSDAGQSTGSTTRTSRASADSRRPVASATVRERQDLADPPRLLPPTTGSRFATLRVSLPGATGSSTVPVER
jgi:hypothetical protein